MNRLHEVVIHACEIGDVLFLRSLRLVARRAAKRHLALDEVEVEEDDVIESDEQFDLLDSFARHQSSMGLVVSQPDALGKTALIAAASAGQHEIVSVLLEFPEIDWRFKDWSGKTALHHAAERGHLDVVRILIGLQDTAETDAAAEDENDDGKRKGTMKGMRHDADKRIPYINLGDHSGRTPLHTAAAHGHVGVVQMLLREAKADPFIPDWYGSTPMHAAARLGNVAVLKLLLTETETSASYVTPMADDENMSSWKKTARHGVSLLEAAVCGGSLEIVEYLLQAGAATHLLDSFGTPMCLRAWKLSYYITNEGKMKQRDREKISHMILASVARVKEHLNGKLGSKERCLISSIVALFGDGPGEKRPAVKPKRKKKDISMGVPSYVQNWKRSALGIFRQVLECSSLEVDNPDTNGMTALHLATELGEVRVVTELLERGANPARQDSAGRTSMHIGAKGGDLELLQLLCSAGSVWLTDSKKKILSIRDNDHRLPIHVAVIHCPVEVVEWMVTKGRKEAPFNVNALADAKLKREEVEFPEAKVDGDNSWDVRENTLHMIRSPLYLALLNGKDGNACCLLRHGAVCGNGKKNDPWPEFTLALQYSCFRAAVEMLRMQRSEMLRMQKGHSSNPSINGRFYISRGPEAPRAGPFLPLQYAVINGEYNLVETLIEHGANVNAKCKLYHPKMGFAPGGWGRTALYEAIRRNCTMGMIRCLLDHGANVNEDDEDVVKGESGTPESPVIPHYAGGFVHPPLHCACQWGKHEIVNKLLEKGADVTRKDGRGWTPLHYAAKGGHKKLLQLLVRKGAKIEEENINGDTSLMKAVFHGHTEIAILLYQDLGADFTKLNIAGETVLHYASRMGAERLAEIFLKAGADASAVNQSGSSPLHYAMAMGHLRLVQLLLEYQSDFNVRDNYEKLPGYTPYNSESEYDSDDETQRTDASGRGSQQGKEEDDDPDDNGLLPFHYIASQTLRSQVSTLIDGGFSGKGIILPTPVSWDPNKINTKITGFTPFVLTDGRAPLPHLPFVVVRPRLLGCSKKEDPYYHPQYNPPSTAATPFSGGTIISRYLELKQRMESAIAKSKSSPIRGPPKFEASHDVAGRGGDGDVGDTSWGDASRGSLSETLCGYMVPNPMMLILDQTVADAAKLANGKAAQMSPSHTNAHSKPPELNGHSPRRVTPDRGAILSRLSARAGPNPPPYDSDSE